MDVQKAAGEEGGSALILTGHDKILSLRSLDSFDKIWEKRPDPKRKIVPDHLKVILDDHCVLAVTSTTDK
jgi:hypothetical protein